MNDHYPWKIDDHVRVGDPNSAHYGLKGAITAIDYDLENIDVFLEDSSKIVVSFSSLTYINSLEHRLYDNVAPNFGASFMESQGLDTSDPTVKDSNPKDALGCLKPSTHFIPRPVLYEVGNVLFSGARKYGAFNWRVAGVRASVYQNAAGRHTDAWQEGQDLDPDTSIHHLSHAIAGLMIIRDAMICDKFVDDRPPSAPDDWMKKAQDQTNAIIERQPKVEEPYTQVGKENGDYD